MNAARHRTAAMIGLTAVAGLTLSACSEEGAGNIEVEGLSEVSGELQGEGASSQQRAMDYFASLYEQAAPGSTLSYNASGSGAGQKQFIGGEVAFAGSDSPLKDDQVAEATERCSGNAPLHLPMVIGPVAIAYNLGDIELTLTPDVVAKIFNGDITEWNDPAIAELNDGADLPDSEIEVVYRSDESGTTDNFMKFLSASAGDVWPHEHSKAFPSGTGAGAKGSSGVADQVKEIEGSITYVESGFAEDNGLGIAKIDFGNGPVELNAESVNTALENLEYKSEGNDMVVDAEKLFQQDGEGAYPLVLTTYEIVCSSGYDDETRDLLKNFLKVVLEEGQGEELANLGYIPVDGAFKDKLVDAVDSIN
ncbi:phosphate ABC transporter substrate-binding protein PstS [Corynebacterium sp. TAE3-ERU12]|uniref:phosphate ABC transporter substrate-binding protein PstS n=1 Tax=Corynebacterium sp. TAE3-ERU12 TaxID=2849491 RepID=UPI00351D832F